MRLHGRPRAAASPAARPNPNFESSWPVFTYSCVCASMPGVTRSSTVGHSAILGVQGVEAIELVERVDNDARHTRGPSHAELVDALVVPVEDQALGRKPRREGDVQLTAGGDVEPQAFLVDEPGHRPTQEGLGRRRSRRPAPKAATASRHRARRCVLVVDEERRAVLGHEVDEVDAADRQTVSRVDGRRVGQEMARDGAHVTFTSRRGRARPAHRDRWRVRCAPPRRARAGLGSGPR